MNSYPIEDSAFIHRTSAFSAFMDVFWFDVQQQPLAEAFLDFLVQLHEQFRQP